MHCCAGFLSESVSEGGRCTRTPQRIPHVSIFRLVFGSAMFKNRSRRVEGMNTLRRSWPFSRYAIVRRDDKGIYSRLRIAEQLNLERVVAFVLGLEDQLAQQGVWEEQ